MKKTTVIATTVITILLGFLAGRATAQTMTATTVTKGKYLGVDGAEFYKDTVQQSDLLVAFGNCFADVWHSSGFNNRKEFDKEVDLSAGCSKNAHGVNIAYDGGYFFVQKIDVLNANLTVSRGALYFRLEGYRPRIDGGPRKGLMVIPGIRRDVKFGKVATSINANLRHDSGAFGFDRAWLGQAKSSVSVAIGKTTLIGGLRFSKPITTVHDGRKQELVWEIGISRSFGGK